jgi:hypothetical protein
MKPTILTTPRMLLCFALLGVSLALVSWDFKQSAGTYKQAITDTVPKTKSEREKKVRDLDDVLDELNAVDIREQMEKARKEITEAMEKLDGEKIRLQIEKSMKDVDLEKIRKEVEESMSKFDGEKLKEQLAEAMKEIDAVKIQKEVQESLAKIDWEKIKTELEEVKKIDMDKIQIEMEKVREEMKELGPKLEKELENAKVEIEKAKTELKAFKEFVDGLEKDGLLNKKEPYTIKHKDGELTVNGKKVSSAIYSKYRDFLEKHKTFSLEKEEDDFNLDID